MTNARPGTLSGRNASQDAAELAEFIALLRARNVRRYLEIGARHGDTFYAVMCALPEGSLGLAVDLPGGEWGTEKSRDHLLKAQRLLRARGYDARHCFGSSHSDEVRAAAVACGPYDAVLIDADHRYEPVRQDWLDYSPLAPLVALHDIAGEGQVQRVSGLPVEVPRLWAELKPRFPHREIVAPGSAMGIGVIFR